MFWPFLLNMLTMSDFDVYKEPKWEGAQQIIIFINFNGIFFLHNGAD